ncbi:MAG: T9SS type A sorting domain-containing protein [Bacteroidota bacterium]
MKQLFAFFIIFIMALQSRATFAQTASDYYLPLRAGSQINLITGNNNSGWAARTTTFAIEGIDTIAGKEYFKEVGEEFSTAFSPNIFHVFWLRKDSAGNVVIGAISTTQSTKIDSATIVSGMMFPNQYLTKGYSSSGPWGNQTFVDSVLSITQTVNSSVGTFNNCLEICESHFDSTGTAIWREYHYYAYGVGMVKNERTMPANEAHTDELVSYGTTGVHDNAVNLTPKTFSLSQNYPNPFNPSTSIRYQLPEKSYVTLKVFTLLGKEIATLVNKELPAGSYSIEWNAVALSSGVYFYHLQAGNYSETKKLVLLK